jgi:hypothetical protein
MNFKMDTYIQGAFKQMVEEASTDPRSTPELVSPRNMHKRNARISFGFTAATFLFFVLVPPIALQGKISFADHAATLVSHPEFVHYAEVLSHLRIK